MNRLAKTGPSRHPSSKPTNEVVNYSLMKANRFRKFNLLINFGFSPWVKLLEYSHLNDRKARVYYRDGLMKRYFDRLIIISKELKLERLKDYMKKSSKALYKYRFTILKKVFKSWIRYIVYLRAVAKSLQRKFNLFFLCKKYFWNWKIAFDRRKFNELKLIRSLIPRGNRCIRRHYWNLWLDYMNERKIDREIQYRSNATWLKVQKWLG